MWQHIVYSAVCTYSFMHTIVDVYVRSWIHVWKVWRYQKGLSETVIRQNTDNTMAKRKKGTNGNTT